MNWASFTAIPNGTRVLNHGWDQCVALANLYHESVIGGSFVPVASAYQWWTQGMWQVNDKYVRSSTPVAGAIFIARYGIYNAPDGHIGVVTSVNSNGTFNTMEQNAGTWRYVGRYTRGMGNILGFLVPKNNPAGAPVQPPAAVTKKKRKNKMDYAGVMCKRGDGYYDALMFCMGNGESHYFYSDPAYIHNIGKTYQTGPVSIITRSHYDGIVKELAATRKRLDLRK